MNEAAVKQRSICDDNSVKIGYLVPEFPGQTHGFFWREVLAIEAAGETVDIFSTRRPKVAASHGFSETASARTQYLADISPGSLLGLVRAMLAALRLMFRKETRELRREVSESLRKLFMLAVIGARLDQICKQRKITHLHVHSCADAAYVAAFSRLSGGPPYSLSLHGDLAVYGTGHNFKFAHAKFVACVTEALCHQVKTKVPRLTTEPKLVRMGIEYNPLVQKGNDWSASPSLRILTVSRLNAMKGHTHAIRAVAELRRRGYLVTYDIVGEGDHLTAIEQCIRENDVCDHVRMVGTVANDKVTQLLTRYDAFVLPSVGLGEAAPVAVMEAMSVGLPVICSIIGGTPEMIEHRKTGFLFEQGDEAALSNVLAELAEDEALRAQIGKAGRDHALDNFLTSRSAALLVACIKS